MNGAANIAGLIELAEQGIIPDDGAELISVLEMLPELFEKLGRACSDLCDWIISQPDAPDQAASEIADMQVHMDAARETAGEAYMLTAAASAFWTGDDGGSGLS